MRADAGEIVRFAVVGVAASALHIGVALALIRIGALGVYGANSVAFLVAVVVSYFGHHRWTFDREGRHTEHFPRFVATAILGFFLNQCIILLSIEVFGFAYWVGILIVVATVPGIVYLLCKLWAFAVGSGAAGRI